MTIKQYHVIRKGSEILVGIAVECAVLDVVTSEAQLHQCLQLLQEPHRGCVRTQIGQFGSYPVALNVDVNGNVSLFVDGPNFEPARSQSAAIWLSNEELRRLLLDVLAGKS